MTFVVSADTLIQNFNKNSIIQPIGMEKPYSLLLVDKGQLIVVFNH